MKNKKYYFILMTTLVFFILAKLAVAYLPDNDIQPEEAVNSVKKFTKSDENIERVDKDEIMNKYEVRTKNGKTFWVDAKDGKISGSSGTLNDQSINKGDLPLTKESGIQLAEKFVRDRFEKFDELKLSVVNKSPDDTYEIIWQKVDSNGAKLPMWAKISVNLETGQLSGYAARDETVSISTKAKISKEAAIEIAKQKMTKESRIEHSSLLIVKDNNGQEKLCWQIGYINVIDGGDDRKAASGEIMNIDAMTGDVL